MAYQEPHALASELQRNLKNKMCVVKLKRGADHLGMARMEVEQVYADDRTPESAVLRVVGRQGQGSDHAMLALPLDGQGRLDSRTDGGDYVLRAGDFELDIRVDKTGAEG